MTVRDQSLRASAAGLVVLHGAAALFAPGFLWGVSQLAAWGPLPTVAWTLLGLLALVILPRTAGRGRVLEYPNRRSCAAIALLSTIPFTLLHERVHLFGDGALLIRDRGLSATIGHAPLLVHAAMGWIQLCARWGWTAEVGFRALSVGAGAIVVYALLRLAAALTADRGGRFLAASLLLTAGAMQLFCGHVEYYALPAAVVAIYLLVACRALTTNRPLWPTWWLYAFLIPLHLETLAIAPGQLYLGWYEWRRRGWRPVLPHVAAAAVLVPVVARLSGASAEKLGRTTFAGLGRYVGPYFDAHSPMHDFGFFAPGHVLAVLNDVLLAAPLVVVALPVLWALRRTPREPLHWFLGFATAGALAFSFLFHRELGAYRDWDILAANGFVGLAWVASRLVRPHPGSQRTATVIVLVAGLHHLVPWVMMQTAPARTLWHLETSLAAPGQWSAHAAGYMWEEIAIYHRLQGDENASFAAYEKAVHANPSDARYRVGYANRLLLRGELEAAEREYRIALQKRPRLGPALNNLAIVIVRRGGDLEEARRNAHAAVDVDPGNAEFWATLGGIELQTGHAEAGRQAVQEALRLRPDLPSALKLQALLASPPAAPVNGLLEPHRDTP